MLLRRLKKEKERHVLIMIKTAYCNHFHTTRSILQYKLTKPQRYILMQLFFTILA